ncbi:Uncharacterized protein OBRU01_13062 [Operophtera brumata]|uniref:Apple domain-containing protein n=1 Tax=Operophtera brumata TaxID=104452 RepID=A0A0L7L911_OPEBR|nr:Uncharacterized protein OBRU01_13062 [Operophtera brumata]
MKSPGISIVLGMLMFIHGIGAQAQCERGRSATFVRWSGVTPDKATPVFVYSASSEEDSLTGACLSRCRELEECAAVIVLYGKGTCQGVATIQDTQLRVDNDAAYFTKICLPVPEECSHRWWALESTPGYHLHADGPRSKLVYNTTVQACYEALLVPNREKIYR